MLYLIRGSFIISTTKMNGYIGYIRVSTPKQGVHGVSLQEQRDAILHYASGKGLRISFWEIEIETAGKKGRPVFKAVLKRLRNKEAKGIIIHKLDRGARNLHDWVAIGDLSDEGVDVHFVSESLDLQSRNGRLSADIQAVVAADYIRNVREEARKGFYGRLKQGIYPLGAPIGYQNKGKAKPKTIDPVMGPLVLRGYELYAEGRYSFETLGEELYVLGLRNRNGKKLTKNGISTMLNNTFYVGIIHLRKTKETFVGIHEPLVSKQLFDRVQAVLAGKTNTKIKQHSFQYRQMLSCTRCQYTLSGERQKGRVYYRCHTFLCRVSLREDAIDSEVKQFLGRVAFSEDAINYFRNRIIQLRSTWISQQKETSRNLNLQVGQIKDRLNRLTDAYLDGALDKAMLDERKKGLLLDQTTIEEKLRKVSSGKEPGTDKIGRYLELAGNALLSHEVGSSEEKRKLVKTLTSNWSVTAKKLVIEPSIVSQVIVNQLENQSCDLYRDEPRTLDMIIDSLAKLDAQGQLPDLNLIPTMHTRT